MKKYSLLILFFLIIIPCFSEPVTISPNWEQCFYFANKSGQAIWTTLGIVLIAASVIVIIFGGKNALSFIGIKSKISANIICFLLIGLSVFAILYKPSLIRWNNEKIVDKNWLEYKGEKYIWDSLEVNCLIEGTPNNCYRSK